MGRGCHDLACPPKKIRVLDGDHLVNPDGAWLFADLANPAGFDARVR